MRPGNLVLMNGINGWKKCSKKIGLEDNQIEIANGLLDIGKGKEAVEYLTKIIYTDSNSTKAYELRGAANYMLLNIEEAIQDYTKAIQLDGRNDIAYSSRGVIWRDRQLFDKAHEDFTSATKISPENLIHKINIAHAHIVLKNYYEALIKCEEVLNFDPANYYALLYKADSYLALKEYRKSVEIYKAVVYNFQADSFTYNNLAFSQIYTGDLKEAKKNFKLAIKLTPDFPYPWDNLGYVYYLEKNFKEALGLINKSIELNVSNSWAYKNRALVYLATGEKEKAYTDLLFALELGYTKEYDNEVEEIIAKHF